MMLHKLGLAFSILATLGTSTSCSRQQMDTRQHGSAAVDTTMDTIAEGYARLVLALGQHDRNYVDAYYGPADWRTDAESKKLSLDTIASTAARLRDEVRALPVAGDELARLRHSYLETQLGALAARVAMRKGERLTFDQESKALYDAVAPTHTDQHFRDLLDELEPLLPGDGPLIERYAQFKQQFVVPPARLDATFRAAIDECRKRTLAHVQLPAEESFEVEYVTDKPWGAYNWYKGGYHSLIQVNTDLPVYIDRAIDLACHEGYPGHHVYNALLEQHLVLGRGWYEFSVYPLFSPQSLIAEGTANFGIEVAFPGEQRTRFERDVLFPLAGLDASEAERYYQIQEKVAKLSYAGNEAARGYLDGKLTKEAAADWLSRFGLMPAEAAWQRIRFVDTYRSYVINYNLGKDLVRQYVEAQGGTEDQPQARWRTFVELISSPRLPSGLQTPR